MSAARIFLSCLILCLGLAEPLRAQSVTIFAASSLKDALDAVIAEAGVNASVAYGGSAAMARQIAQGADADIVILAHRQWMDWLAAQNGINPAIRCDLIGNTLVIAGAKDAQPFTPGRAQDILDRLAGARLATGRLNSVPAGQYARAYLQERGWLEAVQPHLAETSNVRMALALVARGETPLGFVYASDVAAEPRVRTVFHLEGAGSSRIRYPAALLNAADSGAERAFAAITNSDAIFERFGFAHLPPSDPDRCS